MLKQHRNYWDLLIFEAFLLEEIRVFVTIVLEYNQ